MQLFCLKVHFNNLNSHLLVPPQTRGYPLFIPTKEEEMLRGRLGLKLHASPRRPSWPIVVSRAHLTVREWDASFERDSPADSKKADGKRAVRDAVSIAIELILFGAGLTVSHDGVAF